MTEFTQSVVRVVGAIPLGQVLSYGDVAALSGRPGAARQVVYVLRGLSGPLGLPWHRVVGKGGVVRLPLEAGGLEQIRLLEAEGWKLEGKTLLPRV